MANIVLINPRFEVLIGGWSTPCRCSKRANLPVGLPPLARGPHAK